MTEVLVKIKCTIYFNNNVLYNVCVHFLEFLSNVLKIQTVVLFTKYDWKRLPHIQEYFYHLSQRLKVYYTLLKQLVTQKSQRVRVGTKLLWLI